MSELNSCSYVTISVYTVNCNSSPPEICGTNIGYRRSEPEQSAHLGGVVVTDCYTEKKQIYQNEHLFAFLDCFFNPPVVPQPVGLRGKAVLLHGALQNEKKVSKRYNFL